MSVKTHLVMDGQARSNVLVFCFGCAQRVNKARATIGSFRVCVFRNIISFVFPNKILLHFSDPISNVEIFPHDEMSHFESVTNNRAKILFRFLLL